MSVYSAINPNFPGLAPKKRKPPLRKHLAATWLPLSGHPGKGDYDNGNDRARMSVKWCGTRKKDQALDCSLATDTLNDQIISENFASPSVRRSKTSRKLPGRELCWRLSLHQSPHTDQFDGGGVFHNRVGRKRQHDELCGWRRGATLTGIL